MKKSTAGVLPAHNLSAILVLVLLLLLPACDEEPNVDIDPIPPGAFRYSAFQQTERPVVQGWLRINATDPLNLTGDWHLEANATTTENVGPQIGDGQLRGTVQDGIATVNLNPDQTDNNVILTGVLTADTFNGQWAYINITGVVSRGDFQSRKEP